MSCYHPLRIVFTGSESGYKVRSKVVPFDSTDDGIVVPCGKCIGCRLDYSRTWANRLMMENLYHDSSYFVTLTYDRQHEDLIRRPFSDENGEVCGFSLSLNKKHCQDFMKRLRDRLDYPVRYFAAGEYGDSTKRPHMHLIIFGLRLDDLKIYKRSKEGWMYYNSDFLQSVWPFGYVVVAKVCWETCAYVARYVTKKYSGDKAKEDYDRFNLEVPWCLMSRRPGLGAQYFLDHPDCIESDFINFRTSDGGRKCPIPRYFLKLAEKQAEHYAKEHRFESTQFDPADDLIQLQRVKRNLGECNREIKCELDSRNYLDILKDEEYNLQRKIVSLDRSEN